MGGSCIVDATQDNFDELTGAEVEQRTGESATEYH